MAALVTLVLGGCDLLFQLPHIDGPDAGGDAPLTACGQLPNICGPTGTGSCCDSLIVPGGTFARSYDVSSDGMFPDSSHTATVSDFRLDKYEVTVGRFRPFVLAGLGTKASPPLGGTGTHPSITGSGWDPSWNASLVADTEALVAAIKCDAANQTWTDVPSDNENRPVNCTTWYEAMAFCVWDGGFLPTEAEWNYAAAGGDEQRAYPWSSPPGFLGIDDTRASWNCMGDGQLGCTLADLVPVGTKPAGDGRWGQSDLSGNVSEWTLDWYAISYVQNPCNDCANLTPAQNRAFRGGGYSYGATSMRTAARTADSPIDRPISLGLRCARPL